MWLVLDPVVRVDPHDRVLHHQLWRLKVLVPCRFRVRLRGRKTRSGDALTSDYGRVATDTVMPRSPERPSCIPWRKRL